MGYRPLTGFRAAWGVCALMFGWATGLGAQERTPAGTPITNVATVRFEISDGTPRTLTSNPAVLTMGQRAGVEIEPPRSADSRPGSTVVFHHTVHNLGNGLDHFSLFPSGPTGWNLSVYDDVDGDGLLSATDTLIVAPLTLAMGASRGVLFAVEVPTGTLSGSGATLNLTARSTVDPLVQDVVQDLLAVDQPATTVAFEKSVDRAVVAPGDIITYTLRYTVGGEGSLTGLRLIDEIPDFTAYLSGSLQISGNTPGEGQVAVSGSYVAGENRVEVEVGDVAAGDTGVVSFQVEVLESVDPGTTIHNWAWADFSQAGVTDTVSTKIVETVVAVPTVDLAKTVEAPDSATNGGAVTYRLRAANTSNSLTARSVRVVDTLPDLLAVEEVSHPELLSTDGRTLIWTVPEMAPGDSISFTIRATVQAQRSDALVNENRATLTASGGLMAADTARAIPIRWDDGTNPGTGPQPSLALGLRSLALEVSLGQRVPLELTLTNDGDRVLDGLSVDLDLPDGIAFVPGTALLLSGALAGGGNGLLPDSVQVVDGNVRVFLPGHLAVGDSTMLRLTVTVVTAPESVLETLGVARGTWLTPDGAVGGPVTSNLELAWIQARRNRAMETRTITGRVWIDLDGDGRQNSDEPGLGGVDIWTEDGEVVTTDPTGKFSFVNLRVGQHALRVDEETLPEATTLPTAGTSHVVRMVEVNGWLSPRVLFPVLPFGRPGSAPPEAASVAPDSTQMLPALLEPLRSEEEREQEKGQGFLTGPGVEVFHPVDGVVLGKDQVFVGVRGEAGKDVDLFRNDSLLAQGPVRADGIHDFIGVPLLEGPQVLKVRMMNSWGNERWDSLSVHVSGAPVRAEFPVGPVSLQADGQSQRTLEVLLLDRWGVPVAGEDLITVEAEGVGIVGMDADPSSVGFQVRTDADGFARVQLQAGRDVGLGSLTVHHSGGSDTVSLDLRAAARPFMLTGVGNIGVGAGADDFGAVTARGRLGDSTSLTLSYDSRRLDQGRDDLGRTTDPLGEGEYAIRGDASVQRSVSASRYAFAARLARGHDWLSVGDLETAGFADGLTLARYTRALPGAAGRLETGPVTWQGFGAYTTQLLKQAQIRGDGSSGPYLLAAGVLPGTERIALEVRAVENATRVVSRRDLVRYVDYQIDYLRGTLLFKEPIPAADPFGNPVFVMATFEVEGGGEKKVVWGGRASADLSDIATFSRANRVPVGLTFVQDDLADGRFRLLGADLGLDLGQAFRVGAEVAHAEAPDSSDTAFHLDGTASLFEGGLTVKGRWLRIGDEFMNPANRGLLGGTEELAASAAWRVGDMGLRLERQDQQFRTRDLERSQSRLEATRSLFDDVKLQFQLTKESVNTGGLSDTGGASQLKVDWKAHDRIGLWLQGRRQLWSDGADLTTGDFIGAGASLKINSSFSVESRHLRVFPSGDNDPYSITNLGVRSTLASGAKAWGSYQLTGGIDGPSNAAILGLSHALQLGPAWRVTGVLERRKGVRQAPMGDNVLALPFGGEEEDYWSTGLGVEHLPDNAPYRVSARGEIKDGARNSNSLFSMAGDVTLNESFALLSRQELIWTERLQGEDRKESRRIWSLWGLAFRPAGSSAVSGLMKVEWKDDKDPGGVGVMNTPGRDRRLIATVETVWTPAERVELAGRYSFRRAKRTDPLGAAASGYSANTTADYVGAKGEIGITGPFAVRVDLRLLNERLSQTREWDVAPSVMIDLPGGIRLQGGYRFGGLQDPDFAIRSGKGAFLNIGARASENLLKDLAGFWRERLAGNR